MGTSLESLKSDSYFLTGPKFGLDAVPYNWPIGTGTDFSGVIEMDARSAHLFDTRDSDHRIAHRTVDVADLTRVAEIREEVARNAFEEVELLATAGVPFERARFLTGELTPVFFGSALTNYGVEHFLRGFLDLCPPPHARESDIGSISAARKKFAGFVFKIQANLDPRHRDRVAFVRVCSGWFRRDMEIVHARTGRKLRLRRAHRVFGQERETMDEAFPGDIIGLVNPGEFRLGDTICEGRALNFDPLPQFSPENFAVLRCRSTERRKQFHRGLKQLLEKEAIQAFTDSSVSRHEEMTEIKQHIQEHARDLDHADKANLRQAADMASRVGEHSIEQRGRLSRLLDSPYFGRIDVTDAATFGNGPAKPVYIGIHSFAETDSEQPLIHDWRAPISSMFYDFELGEAYYEAPEGRIDCEVSLKRQYKIEKQQFRFMLESALNIQDDVLQEELSQASDDRLKNIVATIQRDQNAIIRKTRKQAESVYKYLDGEPGVTQSRPPNPPLRFRLLHDSDTDMGRVMLRPLIHAAGFRSRD